MSKLKWSLFHDLGYIYLGLGAMAVQSEEEAWKVRLATIKEKFSEWPIKGRDNNIILQEVTEACFEDLKGSTDLFTKKLSSSVYNIASNFSKDNLNAIFNDLLFIVNAASPSDWEIDQIQNIAEQAGIETKNTLESSVESNEEDVDHKRSVTIPANYSHYHALCTIYLLFAQAVTGSLSGSHKHIAAMKYFKEWVPNDSNGNTMIAESQSIVDDLLLASAGMILFYVRDTACKTILESGVFTETNLASIIYDLKDIGKVGDGSNDNEIKFINRIAEYLGVITETDDSDSDNEMDDDNGPTLTALMVEVGKEKTKSTSGTKESSKPRQLTISTIAWEHEREDGFLIVGGKKQKGYAIYENKAAYDFIYDLTKKESVQNALTDLKSGDLRHADNIGSEGSENKGIIYYNAKGKEIDDIDDFVGVGDTEVVDVETPYGYGEVVLELSDLTIIRSDIRKTGIKQEQCFNDFKKDTNGAIILNLLSDVESNSSDSASMRKLADEYYLKGLEAHQDNNHIEAMEWYEKAAENGHEEAQGRITEAQWDLAQAYNNGKGVPEDKEEAVKWYIIAAERGHALAQYQLGRAYDDGEGVPEDKEEAAKWYEKAANQGFASASLFLGFLYHSDDGTPENMAKAIQWYEKSAAQGSPIAQFTLGQVYEFGQGVPENSQESLKWYKMAAEQDHKRAQECVTRLSIVNLPNEDDEEETPKGKRITYSTWSEFETAQGEKGKFKKNNLPIAKKLHDFVMEILQGRKMAFEMRYGDGTLSFSISKDNAKSAKRTFARVGLLSVADKSVYLDTLYKDPRKALPAGALQWKKNDPSRFLFRMKAEDDFNRLKDSIQAGIIMSYGILAK